MVNALLFPPSRSKAKSPCKPLRTSTQFTNEVEYHVSKYLDKIKYLYFNILK